jgi:ribonucleoside-diphosphate reductase alpha chain
MRAGEHNVARAYVLYREERARTSTGARAQRGGCAPASNVVNVTDGGVTKPARPRSITALVERPARARQRRERAADPQAMQRDLYDGVPMEEVRKSLILAARGLIEQDPATAT